MGAVAVTPLRGTLPTWLSGDGYGNGDGNGYGYGYGGDGDGDGDGDGYGGDGYGDGYGDDGYGGDGYGDGYGDDGYGDGNGDGYGDDGYGDGNGDGDGYGEYWSSTIAYFSKKWETKQQVRLEDIRATGAKLAFWRSCPDGLPANGGGHIEPAAPGVVHTAPGPLSLCHSGTLHATLIPPKWKGDRWWVVALIGEVVGDDEKYGVLTREIIGECL